MEEPIDEEECLIKYNETAYSFNDSIVRYNSCIAKTQALGIDESWCEQFSWDVENLNGNDDFNYEDVSVF